MGAGNPLPKCRLWAILRCHVTLSSRYGVNTAAGGNEGLKWFPCSTRISSFMQVRQSTTIGKFGGHFDMEEDHFADFLAQRNAESGITEETVAHAELANRLARLKVGQDSRVVSVIRRWMKDGNKVTRYGLIIVRHKLRRRKRFHHALRISEWIAYEKRVVPYDYKEALNHIDLCSRVDVTAAKHLFTNLPRIWRTREAYTVLLSMYSRNSMVSDAEATYFSLRKWGLTSISPVNMMMSLYQKKDMNSKIPSLLNDAKEAGLALDLCSYNILLPTQFAAGGVVQMEQFYDTLKSNDMLNERTHCMMARYYAKAGMNDKAEEMLLKIEEGMETGKFKKLRRTYDILISMYGVLGHLQGVQRIWQSMKQLELTNEDYISMIESFAKVGGYKEAELAFQELEAGNRLHLRIYNAMLNICVAGNFLDKAEIILGRIHQTGFEPDQLTYHHLVAIHLKNDNIQKALDFFQLERQIFRLVFQISWGDYNNMTNRPKQDKRPWIGTFLLILDALAKRRDVVTSEALFREWRVENWKTDVRLFNSLLRVYVEAQEPVAGFVERMQADDVQPTLETKELLSRIPSRVVTKQLF